jgi:hypothetical protein
MAGGRLSAKIAYDVPVDVAFAYLADPRTRPEWQSSLKSVEMLDDGEPRVGMRWRDHTRPGVVPDMVITELQRGIRWAETGTWRAIEADLVLDFSPRISSERTGCLVVASFGVRGRGVLRPVGWAATAAGLLAVRGDLRHAARILSERAGKD